MGVEVAGEEHELEEDQAGGPDRGRAAGERQQLPRDQRLHHEREGGREEERQGEEERHWERISILYLVTTLCVVTFFGRSAASLTTG